jgi:radical SAM-linked protein
MVAPTKGIVRIKWGRKGLTRFLSHLDNMRVLERSIRRATLPVEYSQGFHPHMKVSYGPPLPLGFSSEAEYLDLSLERPFMASMATRLGEALPDGYFMVMARSSVNTRESLSGRLNRALYEVTIDKDPEHQDKLARLLVMDRVEISRAAKEEVRRVDIRPAIYSLTYLEESPLDPEKSAILMELGLGNAGYARPQEIIVAAGIADETRVMALPIHRKELLYIDPDGNRFTPMEF